MIAEVNQNKFVIDISKNYKTNYRVSLILRQDLHASSLVIIVATYFDAASLPKLISLERAHHFYYPYYGQQPRLPESLSHST
jgi:hypothetical protein